MFLSQKPLLVQLLNIQYLIKVKLLFPALVLLLFHISSLIITIWLMKIFVCLVAFRPKSTAMVMAGQSVNLTALFFLGKLEQAVNEYFVHILLLVTDNNPFSRREENDHRNLSCEMFL